MRFKTFLTAFILLLVGLAAVAVAVVKSVDFNAYKDLVAQQVKVALGRDLVIAGDVTVSIGLTPHLSARQVTLRNVSWSEQPQMIALDRVDADIELLPLLFEQIRLRNVTLSGGQILLERNKDGVGNWAFDTAAGNAGAGNSVGAPLPQLDKFAVENFRLRYQDPTHRHDADLLVEKFTARASTSGGPVSWALQGALNKVPVDLKGTVGTLAQLVNGPLPIDLRGTVADVNLQLGGTIRNAGTLKGLDLDLQMSGSNAAKLNPLLNAAIPDTAAFNLVGHVSDPDNGYRLDRLQLTVGSSYISGLAVIFTDRQPTLLRAQVTADRVDLVDFGFSAPTADSKPADQANAQTGSNRIFSDTPWPLGFLTSFDADIALTLQELRRGAPILTNGKLGLSLQGGVLTVKSLKAVIDNGKILATGTLRAADDKPSLDINLTANDVGSAPLLAAAGLSDVLSTGGVNLDMEVSGPARSTHDMVAGLSGDMSFSTGSGTLRNSFARLILADVTKLISFGGSADSAHVSCLAGRFDIDGGKAKTAGLVMDTPGAALVGTGMIDLGAEKLQMRVDSKSKQINLAALAVPVLVTGPLRHPTVTPDTMGAIGNTANFVTGTVNKATLGMLSTLTGLGAQQTLGRNPCAALTSVGSKSDSTGEKIKQGVNAVGTGAKQVVKGVGEGAGTVTRDIGNSIDRGVNGLFGN